MKKSGTSQMRSFKIVYVFFLFVFLIIAFSLTIKIVSIVNESTYSNDRRFTVAIEDTSGHLEIFSLDKTGESVGHLIVDGKLKAQDAPKKLGIFPDGTITTTRDETLSDITNAKTFAVLANYHTLKTNLTILDVLRFLTDIVSHPKYTVRRERVSVDADRKSIDALVVALFSDPVIKEEGLDIQIINASGIPGIGGRLERILSNMGASVIAVSTARVEEDSSMIKYFGLEKKPYTVSKIAQILSLSPKSSQEREIADIIVRIGKDIGDNPPF